MKKLLILLPVLFLLAWCDSSEVKECKNLVLDSLKAPSTAIFYDVHDVKTDSIKWLVKWKVESQNWFWAMGLSYFYCTSIDWEKYPVFKDDWSYMYEYLEEIEKTWTWDYKEVMLKNMYAWKDMLESCEQFIKEYLWEDTPVYWLKKWELEPGDFWIALKDKVVEFYVYIDWNKTDWICFFDKTMDSAEVKYRNWIHWGSLGDEIINPFTIYK